MIILTLFQPGRLAKSISRRPWAISFSSASGSSACRSRRPAVTSYRQVRTCAPDTGRRTCARLSAYGGATSRDRTTKFTDPLGNVTYTVYNDANYEVRTYAGWNGSTGTPTGPTQDSREDRPGSYMESLAMSVVPHLASAPAAPVLAQTTGGSLAATTYYVKVTYLVCPTSRNVCLYGRLIL